MADKKVTIAPVTEPVVDKVVFTTEVVSARVSDNQLWVVVNFWLIRSDSGKKRKFVVLVRNAPDALENVALQGRDSIEETWNYPNVRYPDPSKQGGFALDVGIRTNQ